MKEVNGTNRFRSGAAKSGRGSVDKKLRPFVPFLKIFNIRYFKISNRIVLLLIAAMFIGNPVLGDIVQGMKGGAEVKGGGDKVIANNQSLANLGTKLFSSRSDIFYNSTSDSVNTRGGNTTNICPKDQHRIKERDTRGEEESLRLKRRKERVGVDKERRLGFGGFGSDDEADLSRSSKEVASGVVRPFGGPPGECNSCARERIRSKSLEAIKDSILSKLGMSQPPNVTERRKPKIADHLLMTLLRKRHSHHGSNGLYWIVQDDDLDQMQGDEPYEPRSSDKVSSKNSDFSNKSNFLRSRGNASDNKYSDSSEFQEGEVLMEEEDDYHVRTERIVAFSQPHPRIRHLPHIQYFEFSDKLRASKVKRALLWMYIKGRESASVVGNKITISIYKILDTGKTGSGGSRESPVITSVRADSTQTIPSGSGAWITMEYIQIKNLVADWFRYPQHNLGIVISAEDGNRTNLAVTSHSGNDTAYVPFLEVYVADNRKHRTKRTIGLNCKDSSNETRCCRYPLTVDFMEFGWDWIIAPTKYEANYCAGECPPVFLPQYPHTHVSQLANTAGNGPCCAPRKLSELEMLYFDNNMNIVFGRIPAMIVDRCGCT